ncbi:hypothetical protein Nepgr_016612 [Nepenthes gracilis]|uniref:Uncharacterized protein n=1 Tax=Nepenthes gracilis TaxID=150966 RepID=A0AAD3SQM6_NEPGR|nr:hypothetical protein Nepgr_016612 [Nepenthes gracilis]
MEVQGRRSMDTDKTRNKCGRSSREKKLALLQDVDKLKKKLRHEENIHKALERAFNRPLGALPRLPSYLPPDTQELLAEIAILEEEVVRLEEQVVNYRQGLYQEAIYISSKRKEENPIDLCKQPSNKTSKQKQPKSRNASGFNLATLLDNSPDKSAKLGQSKLRGLNNGVSPAILLNNSPRSLAQMAQASLEFVSGQPDPSSNDATNVDLVLKERKSSLDEGGEKENHAHFNFAKERQSPGKKISKVKIPARKLSIKQESAQNSVDSPKRQLESSLINQERAQESSNSSADCKIHGGDSEPNKISEDVLKCLCSIFTRLNLTNDKVPQHLILPSSLALAPRKCDPETEFQDPYNSVEEFRERDIGCYKHLCTIDSSSIDLKKKRNALFLLHKLKLLLGKLASVSLEGLTHQHKLAFWINTYNSCMLNAFLEHGIPESPETIIELMGEATIVVCGQLLNAITIEHFILRLPFYLKYACPKAAAAKNDELEACSIFGLEWSEPLVTFALSCGSWSSPAVRVYTASQVESELEAAKRDYLQAAVGISKTKKLIIPKLLEWYLLDFAKDLASLLDWVCLQLPDQLRKDALSCIESKGKEPLSQLLQVVVAVVDANERIRSGIGIHGPYLDVIQKLLPLLVICHTAKREGDEEIREVFYEVESLEEAGRPKERVAVAWNCLLVYDPATYWNEDLTASFQYLEIRDFAYAYQTRLATPSMVAEQIISALEDFKKKRNFDDVAPVKYQCKPSASVLPYVGVACLGAILFGYHLGVIVGSFTGGSLADKFGRTKTFQLDAIPLAIGAFVCATAQSVQIMMIGLLLCGIGIGISSALVPSDIFEISPIKFGSIISIGTWDGALSRKPRWLLQRREDFAEKANTTILERKEFLEVMHGLRAAAQGSSEQEAGCAGIASDVVASALVGAANVFGTAIASSLMDK